MKPRIFILTNSNDWQIDVLNIGASLYAVLPPNRQNLVLNYPNYDEYISNPSFLGCTVGPLANRVSDAHFSLAGQTYQLEANEAPHCLHSGQLSLHNKVWQLAEQTEQHVLLTYKLVDAQFPGPVQFTIRYELDDQNRLHLTRTAHATCSTVIDLTNHSYWNLSGEADVLSHLLTTPAEYYLPCKDMIPTGAIEPVASTAHDFRAGKTMGAELDQLSATQGYDHYYILPKADAIQLAAQIKAPQAEYSLSIYTDAPGYQFYTGNFLAKPHLTYQGFCIETQNYPNAINQPSFPSPILPAGQTYEHTTIYQFEPNA